MLGHRWTLLLVIVPVIVLANHRSLELTIHRHPDTRQCTIVRARHTQQRRLYDPHGHVKETSVIPRHDGQGRVEQIRLFALMNSILREQVALLCSDFVDTALIGHEGFSKASLIQQHSQDLLAVSEVSGANDAPPLEVQLVAGSGSSVNRVDVTFFSDGYLVSERAKFVADVTRLVDEISANQTFHTVAPLLNFWAAFSASNESGVGVGGKPKDTPFGLYRDGTELRGLYYARPEVARAACDSLGDRCDYPVLIGNDPYYGGLGGEFVTITPSTVNGALVLRHELGHSVIGVGEEYDGGFAYFGPNAGHDRNAPMPWAHWLTSHAVLPRVERSVMPFQAYPWTLLNTSAPWAATFQSSGTYHRYLVRFSLSGLPQKGDLSVLFDGEDLGWLPKEALGLDRWHYDIYRTGALSEGVHEVAFVLRDKDREGIAQLCSVEILEFGNRDEFNATPEFYGVFPTFSEANETSYRPTNEDCLMRLTTTPNFCSVCTEGLWLSLLGRVDLIDDLQAQCSQDPSTGAWTRVLKAALIPLGQLRPTPSLASESFTIAWKKDGVMLEDFINKTVVTLEDAGAVGEYEVAVKLVTAEVRSDPDGLLTSRRKISITRRCGDSHDDELSL